MLASIPCHLLYTWHACAIRVYNKVWNAFCFHCRTGGRDTRWCSLLWTLQVPRWHTSQVSWIWFLAAAELFDFLYFTSNCIHSLYLNVNIDQSQFNMTLICSRALSRQCVMWNQSWLWSHAVFVVFLNTNQIFIYLFVYFEWIQL